MVEVEPNNITDLWSWRGINFKKKAERKQSKEAGANKRKKIML